jgi:hypothetical protein
MRPLEGGCSCGAVRFALHDALWVVACHCNVCKKRTGSAFGISIVVDDHMVKSASGWGRAARQCTMNFVPSAGPPSAGGLIANRHVYAAGTLDDRTAIEGVGEMRALLQSAVEIILRPVDVPPPQGSHLFRTGRNGLRVGRTPQPLRKSA